MKFNPDILNKVVGSAGNLLVKAGEKLKEVDMGVAYTKASDVINKLDLDGKKKQLEDFLDSPKMDTLKEKARTVKDFAGFIPYYAQSIPSMVKGALGINDIKSGEYAQKDTSDAASPEESSKE